jgi:GTP cyclohydrolase I
MGDTSDEQRFLVDVGLRDLHFPIRARSRAHAGGQPTVAEVGIAARIWKKFEAGWIDHFIRIVHRHRGTVGPQSLRAQIMDYYDELRAASVRMDLGYPFFYEKPAPVSGESGLVRYRCSCSAQVDTLERGPRVFQRLEVPVLTSYPVSAPAGGGGLFAQLSVVECEIETADDGPFPEDFIDLVDRCALSPVYAYLTADDQAAVIAKVHRERKTSVMTTDEIQEGLRNMNGVKWYSVRASNYGMLHPYSTFVATEKSNWAPFVAPRQPETGALLAAATR